VPLDLPQAVKIVHNLVLGGRDLHDAQVYLLRAGGDLIDVFLYGGEMLVTEKAVSEGRPCNIVGSVLRSWCQPAEL